MKRLLFIILILMLAWNAYAIPPTPPVAAGDGSGDVLAGTMGSTGQYCTKNAATKTIDCNTTPSYQAALDIAKGTYTNTYLCKYTSSGTLLDCNVDPAGFQTADGDLDLFAAITPSTDMQALLGSTDYADARVNLGVPGISGTPTDEQMVGWELDGTEWKLKAIGAKTTYTEPAGTNEFLVRTGAGTTGGSGILKGTMTDGKVCTYTASGTVLNCNSDAGSGDITAVGSCTTGSCATIGNADTTGGYIDFLEDSDNGTNYVRLKAPDSTADATVTLPGTTGTLAILGANTFTASQTITGDVLPEAANTRAVGGTSAEYNKLYLGDGAIIYGQNDQSNTITSSATGWSFAKPITIADASNDNYIKVTNNTSRAATASVNEIYPEANVWKVNQNGTEYSVAIGPTAEQISFSGTLTNGKACTYATGGAITCNSDLVGDGDVTGAGDCASGACYDGSSDGGTYIRLYDGTSAYESITGGVRLFTFASSTADSENLTMTLGNNDNTVTLSSSTGADSIISVASYSLGSAGVKLTGDGDGALTLLGLGNGYDEDLTINLDDTENTAVVSSSTGVTKIDYGSIGSATTGVISGGSLTPVIGDADDFDNNFTGANLYGGTYIVNAAGTVVLPAVAAGMNFTIVLEGAVATPIDPDGTGTADTIYMNGLAAASDENITSSTRGAMCVFQYRAADTWMATCNGFAENTPP